MYTKEWKWHGAQSRDHGYIVQVVTDIQLNWIVLMAKKPNNSKLEWIKRLRNATAPGMYPGMNRARKFRDHKHYGNKYGCRGKVESD